MTETYLHAPTFFRLKFEFFGNWLLFVIYHLRFGIFFVSYSPESTNENINWFWKFIPTRTDSNYWKLSKFPPDDKNCPLTWVVNYELSASGTLWRAHWQNTLIRLCSGTRLLVIWRLKVFQRSRFRIFRGTLNIWRYNITGDFFLQKFWSLNFGNWDLFGIWSFGTWNFQFSALC